MTSLLSFLKKNSFILLLLISSLSWGQDFSFLNLPSNAPLTGLGGVNVSGLHQDINQIASNPSLLSPIFLKNFSFNQHFMAGDIQFSSLEGAFQLGKTGIWRAGFTYLNQGKIDGYDITGTSIGNFYANAYTFSISHAHTIDQYSIGATIKVVGSSFIYYQAWAIVADVGASYKHPTKDFQIGLVFKNIGTSLKKYTSSSAISIPLDVQIGITYKPTHMPFRFSFTCYNLTQLNNPLFSSVISKFASHWVIGGEIIITKAISIQTGYNFLKRKELKAPDRPGLTGFSVGGMIKVKKIMISGSHLFFQSNGTTSITLTINLNRL